MSVVFKESCAVACCLVVSSSGDGSEEVNNNGLAELGRLIVLGYTTVGFLGTVGCLVTKS
jgi:hypothetical protein